LERTEGLVDACMHERFISHRDRHSKSKPRRVSQRYNQDSVLSHLVAQGVERRPSDLSQLPYQDNKTLLM